MDVSVPRDNTHTHTHTLRGEEIASFDRGITHTVTALPTVGRYEGVCLFLVLVLRQVSSLLCVRQA